MMRDAIIIIFIIAIVIIGNVIEKNILVNDSKEIVYKLHELKEKMQEEQELLEIANEVSNLWDEKEEKWSIIVTHQELDQIKTAIISVKSGIESGDNEFAYEQIENSIFLVSHIKEKNEVNWKNVF